MNTEIHQITVSGLEVQIIRKAIENLHMGVYPPAGRIRVAAPLAVSDDTIRRAVIGKLGWIKRQRVKFETQPRQSILDMVTGESHYFLGRLYRLRVLTCEGEARVLLPNTARIELDIRPFSSPGQRERVLHAWYRHKLN